MKFFSTFEEFIGDLETKNIKALAIKQQEDDDDKVFDDPNTDVATPDPGEYATSADDSE